MEGFNHQDQQNMSDADYLESRLRVAKEYFSVFDSPLLDHTQFRQGNIDNILNNNTVLEQLGLSFDSDEEYIEFFMPIDTDEDGYVTYEDYENFMYTF